MCGRNGLVFLLLIIPGWAFPQSKQLTLKEIDNNSQLYQQEAEVRIFNYLKANPQERIVYFNGGVRILTDVTENGIPLYTKTFNATEAITLGVPALRSGGSLGINLLGTGIRIGTWDGGKVLNTHVELVGRVSYGDGSGSAALSDHATHTTGTMMATGINADAKGMAPEATLLAFDFTNDVSEMTSAAKPDQTTLLLSNHSYGSVCGWDDSGGGAPVWRGDVSISTTTDYRFGFYDSRAAQYDAIAYNAPYYTIVKAAGNDRGESGGGPQGPDGGVNGFDCIPTESVAKNIITVGAVQNVANYTQPSDVLMTSFSSWGPTDDGRIKPDIVAPGFNVFSLNATSNTGYEIESGTSMSTPAATGTLALLQQLYKNLNSGNYMRSATVKGLIIHTAREAGASPGPDYSYGWGLLDAKAAASLIINKDNQNIFIREASLANGQTYELDLGTPKTGTKIKATLVWTDPAGTSPAPALNPTNKMLVNDLDLRLVDDGSNTQLPWTLNPASPSLAAVAGDNVRDNVEKIELNSTSPRGYKLRVTNKGTLVGTTQSFSLILEYSSQVDPRTTYYWRPVLSTLPGPGSVLSGGGQWTDPGHWSLTSGGPSANVVPGPNDRVVFDENSFANDPDTIVVRVPNSSQSCYSLRWFAKEAVDMSFNGNTLSIGEGMTLLTNKITTSTTGTISFASAATVANSVDLSENLLNKWSLMFNGASTWSVTGSASIDNITLSQGTVAFNGAALHLNQLSSQGTAAKAVSFTSSSLQALQGLSIDFTGITVQSDILSSIIASPSVTNTLNLSAANFQGFISLANGDITVTGSNTIRSIQGNGIARLNGSFLVSNVNLTGGSQLVLQQGTTTTFTDKFVLSTSAASRAKILSSGANATITFADYFKICVDYTDVTNVDVSGSSVINVGANGTLTNSQGWFKAGCDDLLFPDFTFSYTCVKSSTYFTDKSSGPVTSRSWTFGDPASGTENSSLLASPLHYFSTTGPFTATLTITGASGSRSLSKVITLKPNDLEDNTVQINNGNLISTRLATVYQWLKDGQLVASANSRSYNNQGIPGSYTVLTFSETCNKRSDPFLITGIEEVEKIASDKIKIYPNPTSDFLQIESDNVVIAALIMDAVGRELRLEMEPVGEGRYRINVSAIPTGLYILKTVTKVKIDLQKIIIRK